MTAPKNDPIQETDPTVDDVTDEETPDAAGDDTEGADALGDAGKKALDAMKAKWRTERDRAKALQDELVAARKPPADDGKPDLDTIREQVKAEARIESLRERALDKIEAKAARTFKDPEDALLRLGKNVDDFIDDGKIDLDAINDALEELLAKRPDFGVTQGEPKRFKGSGDVGAKGTAGKPQLTRTDVDRLFKDGKHAEIEQARQDGRLNNILGIT